MTENLKANTTKEKKSLQKVSMVNDKASLEYNDFINGFAFESSTRCTIAQ